MILLLFFASTSCVISREHRNSLDVRKLMLDMLRRDVYYDEQSPLKRDTYADYENLYRAGLGEEYDVRNDIALAHDFNDIPHDYEGKEEGKTLQKKNHFTNFTVEMPGVAPKEMDTYLCVSFELPRDNQYIVEFRPAANMHVAHHMILHACERPYRKNTVWPCKEMQPECGDGKERIVYAWAKNAPALKMPAGVGFHVGGDSLLRYLVLQVHYLHVASFQDGKTTDRSGVKFTLDRQAKQYLAGIYEVAKDFAVIPPRHKKVHIDSGCYYAEGPTFRPFRFRVHAHSLGVVITGYRVRKNKWTLIGRGDPQRPQAFYKSADITVQAGDTIMIRCTYNSKNRDTETKMGPTHKDEMCNFYIMYYYNPRSPEPTDCVDFDRNLLDHFPASSDVTLAEAEKTNLDNTNV